MPKFGEGFVTRDAEVVSHSIFITLALLLWTFNICLKQTLASVFSFPNFICLYYLLYYLF